MIAMDYLFSHWTPDFIVNLSVQVVGLISAGFILGSMFWLVGFLVHHILKTMKGGV